MHQYTSDYKIRFKTSFIDDISSIKLAFKHAKQVFKSCLKLSRPVLIIDGAGWHKSKDLIVPKRSGFCDFQDLRKLAFANKFATFNFFGDAVYMGIHDEPNKLNPDPSLEIQDILSKA